jgi:predicted O-methyltransferase YrrM
MATAAFHEIRPVIADVEGWMTDDQGAQLARMAASVPDGQAIVEVGSHRGRSTIVLALSKGPGVRLLAVDPFDDPHWGGGPESLSHFERNLDRAGVADRVEFFRGFGEQAAREWSGPAVGLLYLDGAHDYRTVSRELQLWIPHLAPAAVLLCHDAFSSHGVTRAVLRRLGPSRGFAYRGRTGTLALFEHRPGNAASTVAKLLRLAAEMPYFARNLAVKIAIRRRWTPLHRALGHPGTHDPY